MTWKKYAFGPIILYLMLLSACGSAQPLPVPMITVQQCPPVIPCSLTAANPQTNGDLNLLIEQVEADWAACAAQVDVTYQCQQQANNDAQARRNP